MSAGRPQSPRIAYQHVLDEAAAKSHKSPQAPETEVPDTRGLLAPESPWTGSDATAYTPYQAYASGNSTPAGMGPGASPTYGPYEQDNKGELHARDGYRRHHGSWANVSILLLATYATLLSGTWVGLALHKQNWTFIGVHGGISSTMASTIIAAFAKSIELAFVTVFVAFLGQYLSREALSNRSSGITLADMNLRTWMLQPGLIVQSLHSFTYAARTFIGAFAMIAATMALLYTTASDAQVSPKAVLREPRLYQIHGLVNTDFANSTFIKSQCPTPITAEEDALFGASTCSAIEHSGQSYHNYMQYLGDWVEVVHENKPDVDLTLSKERPAPVGMLFDNATAVGSWLYDDDNASPVNHDGNRIINNVTMAMPHAGLYSVAMDTLNGFESSISATTQTQLSMDAQVVSPAVNVLCVEMSKDELKPLIFREWPEYSGDDGDKKVPGGFAANYTSQIPPDWQNKTVVDDLFQWSEARIPPVFPKYPIMFNSVLNYTSVWGVDTIYLLTAGNSSNQVTYSLCSMAMSTEAGCSTTLKIEVKGGQVYTNCEEDNDIAYHSDAPSGHRSIDWPFVAQSWATSLSLGTGITDGNASNSRLLSQLIPHTGSADPTKPTIAEALAVLAGCTLLISSIGGPFNQAWITDPSSVPKDLWLNPQEQQFDAKIRVAVFQSGATAPWQQCFSVVLIGVFLISAFCLFYFIHIMRVGGLVNDFMEFQNMFSLALHSPSDRRLAGTAAGGPDRRHMREPWFIKEDHNNQVFIGDGMRRRGHSSWMSHATSPRTRANTMTGATKVPSPIVREEDIEFDRMDTTPPATYKPGFGTGLKNKLGGLGLAIKK